MGSAVERAAGGCCAVGAGGAGCCDVGVLSVARWTVGAAGGAAGVGALGAGAGGWLDDLLGGTTATLRWPLFCTGDVVKAPATGFLAGRGAEAARVGGGVYVP